MTHEVLRAALTAQRRNAELSGGELRAAADELLRHASRRTRLRALDQVGERIIGVALVFDEGLKLWNYTERFPAQATCLLVGGTVAGPAGIAAAAAAASAAGARRVEAVIVGGWDEAVRGVACIWEAGITPARVA